MAQGPIGLVLDTQRSNEQNDKLTNEGPAGPQQRHGLVDDGADLRRGLSEAGGKQSGR